MKIIAQPLTDKAFAPYGDVLARFAVVVWRDGTRTDEEFRTLQTPFTVELHQ